MRDPCDNCDTVSGYRDCSVCRFNEDNWKMPDPAEKNRDAYWKEIRRINSQGIDPPATVLRSTSFDESDFPSLCDAQTAKDCSSIIYLFDMHFDTLRRRSGVGSVAMVDTREQLVKIFLQSGFLQEVAAETVIDDDLPF